MLEPLEAPGAEPEALLAAAQFAADQGRWQHARDLLDRLPADARDFSLAAQMLRDLGVTRVRLMTNNPAKADALRAGGVEVVARVPMPTAVTPENLRYLRTKRDRMGHLLEGLDEGPAGPAGADVDVDVDVDVDGEDQP